MNASRYLPFLARALRSEGPPLHLTLFVTGVCNARCRHCFHWKEVEAGVSGPSLEEVERLAESSSRMGPLLWVSFGGGEPFLRRDLAKLGRAFGKRGLRHLAVPTNGLVEAHQHEITAELARENPDTYLTVSVSFDGPPEIHDSIRQVPGGHARSSESVRQFLKQKEEHDNLGVGILLCVTQENQDTLADHMEELVRELRPDNVTINLARGTAMEEHLLNVDPARYREVVERKKQLVERGLLPYFDFPLGRLAVARDRVVYDQIAAQSEGKEAKYLPCTAGRLSAVIFEDGSVHPCEILGKSMGNLNEVDWNLDKLWQEYTAKDLRKEIHRTRCTCTWECAQADNVLFNVRSWPRLAKAYARVEHR